VKRHLHIFFREKKRGREEIGNHIILGPTVKERERERETIEE
jgi:hypothetical protein